MQMVQPCATVLTNARSIQPAGAVASGSLKLLVIMFSAFEAALHARQQPRHCSTANHAQHDPCIPALTAAGFIVTMPAISFIPRHCSKAGWACGMLSVADCSGSALNRYCIVVLFKWNLVLLMLLLTPMLLTQELKQYQNADDTEIKRLRELFKTTADTVWQIWGGDACG